MRAQQQVEEKEAEPELAEAEEAADEIDEEDPAVGDRSRAMLLREVNQVAEAGVAGPTEALPHQRAIQDAFGSHDVSATAAHVGGPAAEAADALGADAFTTGREVGFRGEPDLHTAAHEAAHVVQQREGVQLLGGLGSADRDAEAHADAVADRVVERRSAQDLLDRAPSLSAVALKKKKKGKKKAAAEEVDEGPEASPTVDVAVSWNSPFGAKVTGTVTLKGRNGDDKFATIESKDVADASSVSFDGAKRYAKYQAVIQPVDDVKGDDDDVGQFKDTELVSGRVKKSVTSAAISGSLHLNRWNRENVRQRHERVKIDPKKAAKVESYPLFGRSVRLNVLLKDRVTKTNDLYTALPPDKQDEVQKSIFVLGGYAYRNQTGDSGSFSDHSIGMAIDCNYNEGMLQNALMEDKNELRVLNDIVQPVVRTDPEFSDFKIWKAQGQEQLRASHVFVKQFPRFLADLLGRTDDVADIDVATRVAGEMKANPIPGFGGEEAEIARDVTSEDVLLKIKKGDLTKAAQKLKDGSKKRDLLELLAKNWEKLNAWVWGAKVTDEHNGQKDPVTGKKPKDEEKIAYGMIPLNETVLQMFLDTGWDWGGNWGGKRKDYMHFQDESVLEKVKLDDKDDDDKANKK